MVLHWLNEPRASAVQQLPRARHVHAAVLPPAIAEDAVIPLALPQLPGRARSRDRAARAVRVLVGDGSAFTGENA